MIILHVTQRVEQEIKTYEVKVKIAHDKVAMMPKGEAETAKAQSLLRDVETSWRQLKQRKNTKVTILQVGFGNVNFLPGPIIELKSFRIESLEHSILRSPTHEFPSSNDKLDHKNTCKRLIGLHVCTIVHYQRSLLSRN